MLDSVTFINSLSRELCMFTRNIVSFTFLKIIFYALPYHPIFYRSLKADTWNSETAPLSHLISLKPSSVYKFFFFKTPYFHPNASDLIQAVFFQLGYCNSLTTLPASSLNLRLLFSSTVVTELFKSH